MSSLYPNKYGLAKLQKISMSLMGVLVLLTFIGANLQAVFWQSSNWLVSTVLPAVVVDLTNQQRADNNAAPLQRSAVLDAAAKLKAEDMAKNEYFAHFSPKGVSPWFWFDKAGYVYAHAGENLAIHFTDSSEVVDAWMKSPAHRENIVSGKYTEIGVGTAKGKFEGYDTVYVVQLFGTPAVAPVAKVTKPVVKEAEVTPVVTEVKTPIPEPVKTVVTETVPAELALEQVESETTPPVPENANKVVLEATNISEQKSQVVADAKTESALPTTAESPVAEEVPKSKPSDVVVVEMPMISTSSGLAVANITTQNATHAGATMASYATQPNQLLQIVYMVLGFIVLLLITISIILEARRLHYVQVAYGFMLLLGMGGLWFVNALLTTGAVIV